MIKSIDKFGLNILNGWKIQLVKDGKKFIITPAHNIIYKPKDINLFQVHLFHKNMLQIGMFQKNIFMLKNMI